jgi:hypothetical protein
MEMSVMDRDSAPWARQDQYLKECDGVLLTEPRPGDRPVDDSWWAFHGGVHIEDEPQGDSCVITFGHDTEFRLCTGLKVRDRWLKDGNNSRSNFPVLVEDVHHWVKDGKNAPDTPDQGTPIQFPLSADRTVRCSHSANHWRSLSFQDKEDVDFSIESVWFAPDRDSSSRGDAESGDKEGGASGDDGEGSVKGTAVYLVGPYSGYVNASPRPDPTSV